MEYKSIEETIEVPKNTGVKGFLKTIEDILLKKSRVQRISIDARGRITYTYHAKEGEVAAPLAVDFDGLLPSNIIRNNTLIEMRAVDANAAVALGQLFNLMAIDHLNAVAFVGGTKSWFWAWYESSTGAPLVTQEEIYGIPFFADRFIEDHAFFLCAAYSRTSVLVDTQKSYKIVIPKPVSTV